MQNLKFSIFSQNLWSDLKNFFWRLIGYKVPMGRAYTERLAGRGAGRKGTRYTMHSEESEYFVEPDEARHTEKIGIWSRLWFWALWLVYTALWIATLGYVKIYP